jgi:hypothetical protein
VCFTVPIIMCSALPALGAHSFIAVRNTGILVKVNPPVIRNIFSDAFEEEPFLCY